MDSIRRQKSMLFQLKSRRTWRILFSSKESGRQQLRKFHDGFAGVSGFSGFSGVRLEWH